MGKKHYCVLRQLSELKTNVLLLSTLVAFLSRMMGKSKVRYDNEKSICHRSH